MKWLGTSREPFGWGGGTRLNLPEFTWLISCSVVIDHYRFQCHEAMFFEYLQVVRAGR